MARKTRTGVVLSDKMDKTVVVQVERALSHPLYSKSLRRRKKFKAHDEANTCRPGDVVRIEESRPISREKHWRVVAILERHAVADLQPRAIDATITGSAPRGVDLPMDGQETPA